MSIKIFRFCIGALFVMGGYQAKSQCIADFSFTSEGLNYLFEEMSTTDNNDSIIEYHWNFGDGVIDSLPQVNHSYTFPDIYSVQLQIETLNGCRDTITKEVKNCSLGLNIVKGTNCINGSIEVLLTINDNYNVVDSVMVFLDGEVFGTVKFALHSILNLNLTVPGDNALHNITVSSPFTEECEEELFFVSEDCTEECFLSNLVIRRNGNLTVEVRDTNFLPANSIITLGDTVTFDWVAPANSTTSDTTEGPESWDSGVQFVGAKYKVVPKSIGLKPYYSVTKGGPGGVGMSGTIIVNCPPAGNKTIGIEFDNITNSISGYQIALDDIIFLDSTYSYDPDGHTEVTFKYPADGLNHKISIIDVAQPICQLSQEISVPECGGELPCLLNIDASQSGRCKLGDVVPVNVEINAIGTSGQGLVVLLDGAFTIDTTLIGFDGNSTLTIEVPGNGSLHKISVRDIGKDECQEETLFLTTDCSDPCILDDLVVSTGTTTLVDLHILDSGLFNDMISIPADQGLIFNWSTSNLYGIRSKSTSGLQWDSGIRPHGSIYLTPVFENGIYEFEIYDLQENIIFSGAVVALSNCDEGKVPVFLRFSDSNGSIEGFDIYVDNVLLEVSPFQYSFGTNNYAGFQYFGDEENHTISITDRIDPTCSIESSFFAPLCDQFECQLSLSAQQLDTCYNNNDSPVNIEIYNPTPFPKGFTLTRDGEFVGEETMFYDNDSITNIIDTVLSNGNEYSYIVFDILNPNCADTLTFLSDTCITECTLSGINTRLIDSSYLADFPNTPPFLVGCQPDTIIFVSIRFNEKYSDGESYNIYVDDEFYTTTLYELGDGENVAFIPILGDSLLHHIRIEDHVNTDCMIEDSILVSKCFKECEFFLQDVFSEDCIGEEVQFAIQFNQLVSQLDLQLKNNGIPITYEVEADTVSFNLRADGLNHVITYQESENLLCIDSIVLDAPYCLICDLQYNIAQKDSCINGDTIIYSIEISNNSSDELLLSVNGSSQIITKESSNDFTILGNGKNTEIIISSIEDPFCLDTLFLETEDCSPVFCDVDFAYTTSGLQVVFVDSSFTSEEVITQSWSIEGGITILDVPTFTFNFDSIGIYTVCHTIETDSCVNTVCYQINLDPCSNLEASFTVETIGDGIQFTNTSLGEFDRISYDFGDGMNSDEENPIHNYINTAIYTACLTIENSDLNCTDTFCDDIDFVSSIYNLQENNDVVIYPNPIGKDQKIYIESESNILQYSLYTVSGELLQSANLVRNVKKVSIVVKEQTSDGLILIHVKTKSGNYVKKLICNKL